jgi:hypothetical protein
MLQRSEAALCAGGLRFFGRSDNNAFSGNEQYAVCALMLSIRSGR